MAKLSYTTTLSAFKKGDNSPCYTAHVRHNGTVSTDDFIKALTERSGENKERVRYIWELAQAEISRQLAEGNRLELESIAAGIAVTGSFDSANAAWDRDKNKLSPFINAKGELKNALANLETVNVTQGAKPVILSVLDSILQTDGVITGGDDNMILISGKDLSINPDAQDEGVWLEDAKGVIVATATIDASDKSIINCHISAMPESGEYKLVVATRGGMGEEYGVALAKKMVKVETEF